MSGVTTLGLEQEGTTGGDPHFRLDVGGVLGRTFQAWAANLVPFSLVGLVAYIPVLLLIGLLGSTDSFNAGTERLVELVTNFFTLILTGAVSYGVFRHLHGERADTGEVLRTGLSKFGSVWLTGLFVGLAFLVGLCLLVIPGIVLLVRYWVAVPVAVIESPGASASLRRSEELTDGNRWHVFAIAIIMGFIVIVAAGLLGLGVGLASGAHEATTRTTFGPLTQALVTLLSIPLNCLAAVAPAVVYHDLRIGKEGADVEELLKVFE
jgi:hypothetical protein